MRLPGSRVEGDLPRLAALRGRCGGRASRTECRGARILEEIVPTGTRLPITAIESSAPVTVLSRRDIERGGADFIGKVLQTLPAMTGSPLNTNVNVGAMEPSEGGSSGDGSVRTDLRGVATLVLLNGRRFPNGGSGADSSVDLNTLPVSWIDRVEVLSGGASAVYGADAVGGHPEMTRKCPEP